jgi:hypothetical protein
MHLRVLLLAFPLLLSGHFAYGADDAHKISFDQGVDVTAVLSTARGHAVKNLAPIPFVTLKLRKLKKSRLMIAGPGQYPPVTPLITGSAAYPAGLNLRADPKYIALDPSVQQPLEVQWTEITSIRSDLLSMAGSWEGDNELLYRDGRQLEVDRADLERRKGELNSDIARYNQVCTTRPLPPGEYEQCLQWRERLRQSIARLESDIASFNDRVNAWNQRSSNIFERRQTIVIRIDTWESQINKWIQAAKEAIENQCRPLATIESRPETETVFTGGFTQKFEARVTFKSEPKDAPPCEVDFLWSFDPHPDTPGTVIGRISPTTGRTTTFTSGNFTGLGHVILQDTKSGRGTASIVNVRNAAK